MINKRRIGVLFPGQGSQFAGMGRLIENDLDHFRVNFEKGSDLIGLDLWKLVTEDNSFNLNKTEYTQPAIFTLSASLYQIWLDRSEEAPSFVAGHSLGEYNALVASGVLNFDSALRLVVKRGKLMSKVKAGAMAAIIGLEFGNLNDLCVQFSKRLDLVVDCANINTHDQIVIAGDTEAVEQVCKESKLAGAKRAIKLDVSVPSHCRLMLPIAQDLKIAFGEEKFSETDEGIIFIQNVDARESTNPEIIQRNLLSQLHMPVKWYQTMQRLVEAGCLELMECGPGKVLTNLAKRIDKQIKMSPYLPNNK